jgi:hypothetical protein
MRQACPSRPCAHTTVRWTLSSKPTVPHPAVAHAKPRQKPQAWLASRGSCTLLNCRSGDAIAQAYELASATAALFAARAGATLSASYAVAFCASPHCTVSKASHDSRLCATGLGECGVCMLVVMLCVLRSSGMPTLLAVDEIAFILPVPIGSLVT